MAQNVETPLNGSFKINEDPHLTKTRKTRTCILKKYKPKWV